MTNNQDDWMSRALKLEAENVHLRTVVIRGLAGVELSEENDRLIDVRNALFDALREMSEWWAYAMDKPIGAKPTAEDHKKVEQLAVKAINALHMVDPTYVHRLPGGAH